MHVRGADGLRCAGRIDEDLRVCAHLEIGHAVRVQGQVAGSGDVPLEGGNAARGVDPGYAGEVDLVEAVPEVGDGVRRGSGRVGDGIVGERHVPRASRQRIGAGAARGLVVAAVAYDDVVARLAAQAAPRRAAA